MDVKLIEGTGDLSDELFVRDEVFTKEQGFTIPDADEFDAISIHAVLYDGDRPVATGRTFAEEDCCWHLGRIAVLKSHRGLQLGRRVMEELEKVARSHGAKRLKLGAQLYAIPFYQKCGFVPTGHRFFEEFCEHEDLVKEL